MKLLGAVRNLLLPPICPICHDCLPVKYGAKNEMCPECAVKWAAARVTLCRECAEPYHSCRCVPKGLAKAGVAAYIKLVPYKSGGGAGNNLILHIKRKLSKRTFSMLGHELAAELELHFASIGFRKSDAVITYAPRRVSAIVETGFDQARFLSLALSKHTGIPIEKLILRRKISGRAQKKLNSSKRAKNARTSFSFVPGYDLKGKTVILVDDLVTTGATLGECARILKKNGAAMVICASVGYTEKEKRPGRVVAP